MFLPVTVQCNRHLPYGVPQTKAVRYMPQMQPPGVEDVPQRSWVRAVGSDERPKGIASQPLQGSIGCHSLHACLLHSRCARVRFWRPDSFALHAQPSMDVLFFPAHGLIVLVGVHVLEVPACRATSPPEWCCMPELDGSMMLMLHVDE